jgi:GNAT superfamily N-acetyltransferase
MNINFKSCSYIDIEKSIISNMQQLSSPIDSFAEMHILKSNHYHILGEKDVIGYCCIFGGKTITQFYIEQKYRRHSQDAFASARKMEFVSEALVPTCDEFYLSLGLDNYSNINKQAYFFQFTNKMSFDSTPTIRYKLAEKNDLMLIKDHSDDFFDDTLEKQLTDGEIFIGFEDKRIIAFGVYEKGKILKNNVSIGMYTVPEYRNKGVGKQTLSFLIEEGLKENLKPIAGCWYYNHLSKKNLESVGMISNTRYLRIIF